MLRTVGSIINNYKIRKGYISFLARLALLSKKRPPLFTRIYFYLINGNKDNLQHGL